MDPEAFTIQIFILPVLDKLTFNLESVGFGDIDMALSLLKFKS
jgi:hypothetical protein